MNIKIILLKAYSIFIMIHQQNIFMKRYFDLKEGITYDVNGFYDRRNLLIKLLFGDSLINNKLTIEKAKYILDLNNWNKKSVLEFKKDFMRIEDDNKSRFIIYLP